MSWSWPAQSHLRSVGGLRFVTPRKTWWDNTGNLRYDPSITALAWCWCLSRRPFQRTRTISFGPSSKSYVTSIWQTQPSVENKLAKHGKACSNSAVCQRCNDASQMRCILSNAMCNSHTAKRGTCQQKAHHSQKPNRLKHCTETGIRAQRGLHKCI